MEKKEALEILNADTLFKIQRDTSITIRVTIETLIKEVTDSVSKKKIEDILQNKFVAIFEGDADFPDDATEINMIKYVKADVLKELLEGK